MDESADKKNLSPEERLKEVQEKMVKIKGKPGAAEKMPKLLEREKKLRAKIAGEGGKKA